MKNKKIPNFVIRTIKDGKVRIFGRTYHVDTNYMIYDGRLDGMKYTFGIYKKYTPEGVEPDSAICMWGSEKAYRGLENPNEGPEVIDGTLPWTFWYME